MQVVKLTIIVLAICLFSCKTKPIKHNSQKLAPNDPFEATMVESQFFDINAEADNVVEGNEGTIIIVPPGAFVDKDGNTIKGSVKLELAEALQTADMLLSNLTTTSGGKLLQSGGMLYIKPTVNGKEVFIDPKNPLYIEVPTDKKVPGMMAYRGIRDSSGNMDWVNPKPLENFLVPVSLDLLDFLPEGFYTAVEQGIPYRGHLVADKELADSLYYSLAVYEYLPSTPFQQPQSSENSTDMNEAQYNKGREIINGKYTDKSYETNLINRTPQDAAKHTEAPVPDSAAPCGINPASIQVIKGQKFENTYIATREFEERMHYIHLACLQEVLDIYIKNIDKNLWEADKMAFDLLTKRGNKHASIFEEFYKQKLTNVRASDKTTKKISEYYEKQLRRVEAELKRLKEKEQKQQDKAAEAFKKIKKEYTEVLWQREKNRNQKYGLQWSDNGWFNIDTGVIPKSCLPVQLEATLQTNDYDRVYVYVVINSFKSIFRMNTSDGKTFFVSRESDLGLNMPCNELAHLVAIEYKGTQAYYAIKEFTPSAEANLQIPALEEIDKAALKKALNAFDKGFSKANTIETDLEYQQHIYKENQRLEKIQAEQLFVSTLYSVAFKCCQDESAILRGKALFEENCTACHAVCSKVIGPPLAGITAKRDMDWLIRFTKNSVEMIMDGDPLAVKLYNEYNKQQMTTFGTLTDNEVQNIYKYIESETCIGSDR